MRYSIAAAALLAVAIIVPSAAARAPKAPTQPILSCETYSLRDLYAQGKLTLEQTPALLKELHIPGITFNDMFFGDRYKDKAYLDTLKRAVKDAGCVVTGFIIEGNLAGGDENARKRQIQEDMEKMRAAAYLGAPVCRINLGGVSRGEDEAVGTERVIAAFKEMLPLAKQLNLKITIENHGGVSGQADNILKIIKATDPKWVGSCLDFGNWPDSVRYQECQKLAPYAYHVHAKAYRFDENGESVGVDFGRILSMLRAVKYNRAISIEFEGAGDPIEGVKKSRDLVVKDWPGIRTS